MISHAKDATRIANFGTDFDCIGTQAIETSEGAEARRVTLEGREQLEVYDNQKRLVFRFDTVTGEATLNVPQGDLKLNCERGDIELNAAGAVRTKSRAFEVFTTQRVVFAVIGQLGRALSRLVMKDGGLQAECPSVNLKARDIAMNCDKSRLQSRRCEIDSETTRLRSQRHTTETEVLQESSTTRFQDTKDMSQVRTGRARTLIAGLCQFRAKKAMMRSEEDFKITGDKVHLG